jgi:hypothetical protein
MTTAINQVQFPRAYLDAFGRLRISEPQTIFDSKQLNDSQPLFWDDAVLSGAGTSSTFNTNQSSTTIAVGVTTAGSRARQTFRSFNYQPGKSTQIFMTFVMGANAAGITRRVGQFSTNNGMYFELAGSTKNIVTRTYTSGSPVNTAVAQSSWNLDKLDGSGAAGGNPSGYTLDLTKTQILCIDYEWLGVGSQRFGFVIDGKLIYVHQVNNANSLTLVYMQTPNLPLRYEITNDGSGAAAGLTHICATVIVEGGRDETGILKSVDRGTTALTTLNDSDLYPLIALRLKSTHLGATVVPKSMSLICTSTAAYRWAFLLNPTITGTALSFTGITNSPVEADVARTNATKVTAATGTQLTSGYGQASAEGALTVDLKSDLSMGSSIAGTADILVLAVQRLTGTTESFYAAVAWDESH